VYSSIVYYHVLSCLLVYATVVLFTTVQSKVSYQRCLVKYYCLAKYHLVYSSIVSSNIVLSRNDYRRFFYSIGVASSHANIVHDRVKSRLLLYREVPRILVYMRDARLYCTRED
jgi:hypothetical protein